MYQFAGESINSIFENVSSNESFLDLSCITFPSSLPLTNSTLQLLYDDKMEIVSLGWQCLPGFCLSTFKDKSTNAFIDNFLLTPYEMRKQDQKIQSMPKTVAHSSNHIFYLFEDNLSAISKISSNLVFKYEDAFKDIVYDNFRNVLLIRSNNQLYQMPLEKEKMIIWQDYIEIGECDNALDFARRTNHKYLKEIYKMVADISYEEGDYLKSAEEFAYSNESFELVCFKLLHTNQYPALKEYLSWLLDIRIPDDKQHAKCLVGTLLVELMINVINTIKDPEHLSNELGKLMTCLNQKKTYLEKSTIYELLLQCGLIDEYLEFAENIGDYETVVLHLINSDQIKLALEKMDYYITKFQYSFSSILNKYTQLFIKENVKATIEILKKVSLKFEIDSNQLICGMLSVDKSQVDNMCEYLQSLIEESNSKDTIVHNLYLYFLSKTNDSKLKTACIDYLEKHLENYISVRDIAPEPLKEIPFEIEYALKVFTEAKYYEAQALVLSMKDKYKEAVKLALQNELLPIAMFIAKAIFNTKLKKELWLEIFKDQIKKAEESVLQSGINFSGENKNAKVQSALDIIGKSGVLTIEDVLIHMVDNIKIQEFKDQIAKCIEHYETEVKEIKQNISSYNNTAENIKTDLALVKKKAIDVQFNCCQCDICQRDIKLDKIIIFTCGHMFDAKCMMGVITKLAGFLPSAIEKNRAIQKLKQQIEQIENKNEMKIQSGEENKKDKKSEIKGQMIQNKQNIVRVALSYDEAKRVEELKSKINKILIEECVRCGNMILESVFYPFQGNEADWMVI